jgi:hypothetical protein
VPLTPWMATVYSIYGDRDTVAHIPAAWFSAYASGWMKPPDGTAIGAQVVYSNFYSMMGAIPGMRPTFENTIQSELSSFLSVGPDTWCVSTATYTCPTEAPEANMGTVGPELAAWGTGASPLTLGQNPSPAAGFSLFWMDPASGPTTYQSTYGNFTGGPLIAQLTLPSNQPWFVRLAFQGKSMDNCTGTPCARGTGTAVDDFAEAKAVWAHSVAGVTPCANRDSAGRCCPAGQHGPSCLQDIDECATAGCPQGCWHGVNEHLCLASGVSSSPSPSPLVGNVSTTPTFACACIAGFSGGGISGTCDVDVNECASNPCANNATCSDSTANNATVPPHAFSCTCLPGYANGLCAYDFIYQYATQCTVATGGTCDVEVDECASSPCAER